METVRKTEMGGRRQQWIAKYAVLSVNCKMPLQEKHCTGASERQDDMKRERL